MSFLVSLVLTGIVSGCGGTSGPQLYPAGGTVKYQGAPLAGARVTFVPEKGAVAMATTDNEGKFQLRTGSESGCVAGNCKVSVAMAEPSAAGELEATMTPEDMQRMAMAGTLDAAMAKQSKSLIPERYGSADTSGLNFEVTKSGPNDFTVELK